MGSYLSQPVTEKESCSGRGRGHVWACSAMQGWRTNMEDSFNLSTHELDELSLFGVFDGHGGAEVAAFCKQFLPDEVRRH
eukprot:s6512_g1.t1